MKTRLHAVLLSLLCSGFAGAALAQPPGLPSGLEPARPPVERKATAVLRGQVQAADTGGALPRARVAVVGEGSGGVRRVTTTDASGRWEIGGLPAGRYMITVSRPPYVTSQYGLRAPIGISVGISGLPMSSGQSAGRAVELADGETIERLDVRLQRCAVIAGRVTDDLGEPAAFKQVNAMRLQYFEGRRQLVRAGFRTQTNDLGDYRLYGLPAGTYYVMTDSAAWRSAGAADEGPSFAATFHPAGTTVSEAAAITVRAGQERAAIDIRSTATRVARVAGTVVEEDGSPVAAGTVSLYEDTRTVAGLSTRALGNATIQGGRFTLTGVSPGEYFLQALRPTSGPGAGSGQGLLPVSVAGQDVNGVVITMVRGAGVAGVFEFDGEDPPGAPSTSLRVRAEELVATPYASAGISSVAPDWSFELKSISPGARVVRVSGLPDGYVLKAVYLEGQDITDVPRVFNPREPAAGMRIVLTRRASAVSGVVTDDQGKATREYTAIVFSTDAEQWGPGSRRRTTVRPDQFGRFVVSGLPPGEYFAVAADLLLPGEGEDPEFLAGLRDHAVRFTLDEGGRQALSLKVVRLER